MSASTEFADLLHRTRLGDPVACKELVDKYSKPLLLLIRHRLETQLRPLLDPQDALQSAWKDFFTDAVLNHEFVSHEQLFAYLMGMASNKVATYHRKHLDAESRDRRREAAMPADVAQSTPSPDRLAEDDDEWRAVCDRVAPHLRRGLQMLREGHSLAEVAEQLGISERHVRRILHALRPAKSA